MDEAGVRDRRQRENMLQQAGGDVSVEPHESESLRTAAWSAATKGERGHVDSEISERGADAADDAGNVVVAHDEERTREFGLDVDAVVIE